MSDLIKRIDAWIDSYTRCGSDADQIGIRIMQECKAEIIRLDHTKTALDHACALVEDELAKSKSEIERLTKVLEAKPVAYITQAALDAQKRGASSSVRVWLNPDEPNGDVALYTKEN